MRQGIIVENLDKRFGGFRAVNDVSFQALDGHITALLGPSGSGKSTVLRMIAGLERPDRGRIWVAGDELTNKTVQERRLGFVFQHYALFRHMTVRQNVSFGLSVRHEPKPDQQTRVDELLELVGLAPFGERYPDQLSGGQRQRVALARALAPRPKVLLLDEPFGSLDARVRQELRRWLDSLHRELGVTSLLVTHDQEEALELANHVVVMNAGRIEQIGTPDEIYNQPATPFVAGFVGAANVLNGWVWEGHVHFGRSAVKGAYHLEDGLPAKAYVRPHDVRLTNAESNTSFGVSVDRRTNMGWESKLHLRLSDGQVLIAQLPNDELAEVSFAQPLFAELRYVKVFQADGDGRPEGDLSSADHPAAVAGP
jgi:sulfate transport system ATP-binding protein